MELSSVGSYSPLNKTVFFDNGKKHTFRGDLLLKKSPRETFELVNQWARFKGFISDNENILVPNFPPKVEENLL